MAALDPLVRAQKLSPQQANEVYRVLVESPPPASPVAVPVPPPVPAKSVAPPVGWTRAAFGAGIGTVGVGVLASAFVVAYQLGVDSLAFKTVAGMVGPILVLAIVVVATEFAPGREHDDHGGLRTLAANAGSLGIITLALAVLTVGGSGSLVYVSGLVMVVGGVAGYAAWRRQVFVIPAFVGGLFVVARLGDRLVSSRTGDSTVLLYGAFFLAYGVVVALVGWRLRCRQLTGVLGGIVGVSSMALVILLNGILGTFSIDGAPSLHTSSRNDTVAALVIGLLVCVASAAGYGASRQPGFLVVAGLGAIVLPVIAVPFLTQRHPLQMTAVFVVVGGLAAAAGLALAWGRAAPARREVAPSGS